MSRIPRPCDRSPGHQPTPPRPRGPFPFPARFPPQLPLALILVAALAGCDKNPVKSAGGTPNPPVTEWRAWIGTWSSGAESGDIVMDLAVTGTTVAGEVVVGTPETPHVFVSGTLTADSLVLTVDRTVTPNGVPFDLRARIAADSSLTGVVSATPSPTGAALSCRQLPRLRIVEDLAFDVPSAVKGLVYDGSQIWLSTTGDDYLLMSTDGQVTGSAVVLYRDAHWTSDALAFDGTLLWGALPGSSSIGPYSEILAFDADGRHPDSLRVWHRTSGLAWDGRQFWSLPHVGSTLLSFDRSGVLGDSLHLGIPDAYHLEFDGNHFWTLGWFMQRLYQVSGQGRVVAICDLPRDDLAFLAGSIAVEGSRLWYATARLGGSTVHRLTWE